jgi:cohesin complex subunit SA-1/2
MLYSVSTAHPLIDTSLISCTDTLMNPSAALMSTVEDVCDTLKESPGPALADIINCVLRACGCNESVDADSAIDWDGVVDALDNFTEALKQVRQ